MTPPDTRRRSAQGLGPTATKSALTTDRAESSPWDPEPGHHRRPAPPYESDSLFGDPPTSRPSDPDTSRKAGAGKAEHRGRLRADVLRQHQLHADTGLTDDQLAELLPEDHPPSLAKRRTDLTRDGVLVDSGRRAKTRRGADAAVWVLAEDVTS